MKTVNMFHKEGMQSKKLKLLESPWEALTLMKALLSTLILNGLNVLKMNGQFTIDLKNVSKAMSNQKMNGQRMNDQTMNRCNQIKLRRVFCDQTGPCLKRVRSQRKPYDFGQMVMMMTTRILIQVKSLIFNRFMQMDR
jgi:hypothetical protein